MIYQGTLLRVIDNSGARYGLCIKVLKKSPRSRARLGDKIIIVVKRANPEKKVRKAQIHTALVVRDSQNYRRLDGSYIKFDESACVILRKDGQPLAKRILGPVAKELRRLGHLKIISIATIAL
jgi:large subunit ribosomal protein L14